MKEEKQGPRPAARTVAAGLALVFALGFWGGPAAAAEVDRTVVPLGRAVGIKMFSDGVLVVGLSEIATADGAQAPARACGLREGDIITHINSEEVDTIEEVQEILQSSGDEKLSIRAMRGDKKVQMTVQAAQCSADGSYKLGAWIRDSMAGIGTMTFYDPDSGLFGALGHGISDVDTAMLMPLQSGSIMYAEVTGVEKGAAGAPGELHGAFKTDKDLGELYANTKSGVFGELVDDSLAGDAKPVEIASRSEVQVGKATILSNIAGNEVAEYEVEITRLYPENPSDTRNLMLKVTDQRLLETTGGIVQGMSGSPILQNGKLVGAVTHVLVNDPTQGYGILAENMLAQADSETSVKMS
ncbi:SpoIVB peptidase [uncultured Eubacteriales bacterium]|uniref:SpoIVB peptidase n=1 Tax=uncultured Eubacteriales bacterium TaxID=172733 RepID=A0A212K8S5_9FIRM|nr:SpoIVB peptidase [uncultured Eubacteriales bacterium]